MTIIVLFKDGRWCWTLRNSVLHDYWNVIRLYMSTSNTQQHHQQSKHATETLRPTFSRKPVQTVDSLGNKSKPSHSSLFNIHEERDSVTIVPLSAQLCFPGPIAAKASSRSLAMGIKEEVRLWSETQDMVTIPQQIESACVKYGSSMPVHLIQP